MELSNVYHHCLIVQRQSVAGSSASLIGTHSESGRDLWAALGSVAAKAREVESEAESVLASSVGHARAPGATERVL